MDDLKKILGNLDYAFYSILDRMEENMPDCDDEYAADVRQDVEIAVKSFKEEMEKAKAYTAPAMTMGQAFPDWENIKPGEWSENAKYIQYGPNDKDCVEIGLYREPEGGEYEGAYTFQIFDRDNVIACHEAIGLEPEKNIEEMKSVEYQELTKEELKEKLIEGKTLKELLFFEPGQECEVHYAANPKWEGKDLDRIYYIADTFHITIDETIKDPEDIKEVMSRVYDGHDFLHACAENIDLAKYVFNCVDWQSPESFIEADMEFYSDEEWIGICGKTDRELFGDTANPVVNEELIPAEELDSYRNISALDKAVEKSI